MDRVLANGFLAIVFIILVLGMLNLWRDVRIFGLIRTHNLAIVLVAMLVLVWWCARFAS